MGSLHTPGGVRREARRFGEYITLVRDHWDGLFGVIVGW